MSHDLAEWREAAVRQMIMELRNSIIVPPRDMEHYLPIMGPVFDRYAERYRKIMQAQTETESASRL